MYIFTNPPPPKHLRMLKPVVPAACRFEADSSTEWTWTDWKGPDCSDGRCLCRGSWGGDSRALATLLLLVFVRKWDFQVKVLKKLFRFFSWVSKNQSRIIKSYWLWDLMTVSISPSERSLLWYVLVFLCFLDCIILMYNVLFFLLYRQCQKWT